MFRVEKFKAVMAEKSLSVTDVAFAMGISKQALYRKMKGESDFYRAEIQAFRKLVNRENVDDIFLLNKLRFRNLKTEHIFLREFHSQLQRNGR